MAFLFDHFHFKNIFLLTGGRINIKLRLRRSVHRSVILFSTSGAILIIFSIIIL